MRDHGFGIYPLSFRFATLKRSKVDYKIQSIKRIHVQMLKNTGV